MSRINQAVPNREKSNESACAGGVHGRLDNSTDLELDLISAEVKLRKAQAEGKDPNLQRNPSQFAEGNNSNIEQGYMDDEGFGTYGSKRFSEDHINVPQPNVDRPAKAQTITPVDDKW